MPVEQGRICIEEYPSRRVQDYCVDTAVAMNEFQARWLIGQLQKALEVMEAR